MRALPRPAQFYISALFALAFVSFVLSVPVFAIRLDSLVAVFVLSLLIAVLDLYPVILRGNETETTISTAVKVSGLLMFEPGVVIASVFIGTLLAELRMPRASVKKIFNVSEMTVTYTALAFVYHALQGDSTTVVETPRNLVALGGLAVSDLVINSLVVSLVIALATRSSVLYVWSENSRRIIWHDLSMVPLGAFMTLLWRLAPWSVAFAAVPLVLVRYSQQLVADLHRQTYDALMVIARMLDERDEHTNHHCERVAKHAVEIAHALGLSQGEIDVISRAAYLHDIGKIGMSNEILFKPGPLTPVERESAKRHVIVGAALLESFPLFQRGALYVRYHHERWDGQGYPDGLKAEQIPLGARILTVADSFQAMIEDRPYRAALPLETALEEMDRHSGTQFDPEVVRALYQAKGIAIPPALTTAEHSLADARTAKA
jgi:putative nucleotidyltransferase with HDIG domain